MLEWTPVRVICLDTDIHFQTYNFPSMSDEELRVKRFRSISLFWVVVVSSYYGFFFCC